MAAIDIKQFLIPQEFILSEDSADFLPKSKDDSVEMKPFVLGTKESIRGVSFFGALKALDMNNAPWYINHLRLPGKRTDVNPDTQKVVLAILHGLHAYFASTDKDAPSLQDPLPSRFRYTIDNFTKLKDQSIKNSFERVFTIMKRQYLNHIENNNELSLNDLIEGLKTPVKFRTALFFNQETGEKPIPIMELGIPDTQTVRDFYVHKIPLMSEVLGR